MSAQPEALRLAEDLEIDYFGDVVAHDAAAELRCLSIENEALGLHLSERMKDLARVEAQRDALLEALAVVLLEAEHTLLDATRRKARAAIKAVEEQK